MKHLNWSCRMLVAALLTVATPLAAQAAFLVPGGAALATPELIVTGTVLDSVTWSETAGTLSVTVTADVIDEGAANALGGLTFRYQVTNDNGLGGDAIDRGTAINFSGWQTDVGYALSPNPLPGHPDLGTVAPLVV